MWLSPMSPPPSSWACRPTASEPGDRIISIDGAEIASRDDVTSIVDQHTAGDTISITVARNGQMLTVSATLGEQTPNN